MFRDNVIVTSMLLLGGVITVEAQAQMNYDLVSFLIPCGVILYIGADGLKVRLIEIYSYMMLISTVPITTITVVYIKVYLSNQIPGASSTYPVSLSILLAC